MLKFYPHSQGGQVGVVSGFKTDDEALHWLRTHKYRRGCAGIVSVNEGDAPLMIDNVSKEAFDDDMAALTCLKRLMGDDVEMSPEDRLESGFFRPFNNGWYKVAYIGELDGVSVLVDVTGDRDQILFTMAECSREIA